MNPQTPFTSTSDAVNRLLPLARSTLKREFSRLPFNRYEDVTNTVWWLSPSSVNPAYKHGKIFASRAIPPGSSGSMFIGLYVEKGMSPTIADIVAPGKGWGMDSTWRWHELIQSLLDGTFSTAVQEAEAQSELPLDLLIDDGSPASDPQGDAVYFECGHGCRVLRPATGALRSLKRASSYQELGTLLDNLPEKEGLWLDFQIGHVLSDEGAPRWTPEQVWTNSCLPFRNWVF